MLEYFKGKKNLILSGCIFGVAAVLLAHFGNPPNMALCAACFIRDIAGAVGLHMASMVQYMRPEILGIVIGAACMALLAKEFEAKGGSAPVYRFFLGLIMMIGSLIFLGCPLRMVLRLAGGDYNAIIGLFGFVAGIYTGILFLRRGVSLGVHKTFPLVVGGVAPVIFIIMALIIPAGIYYSSIHGPGSLAAPVLLSLGIGIGLGAMSQANRICTSGAVRDMILMGNGERIIPIVLFFLSMLIYNIISGKFHGGFTGQPIAHTEYAWNFLGLYAVGFAAVLADGCPLRQLTLLGQGSLNAVVTFVGLLAGAALMHRLNLVASPQGVPMNGKIVLLCAIAFLFIMAFHKSYRGLKE